MKIIKKIIYISLYLLLIPQAVYANNITQISEFLKDIGFEETYSDNLEIYLGNLNLSEKEFLEVIDYSQNVVEVITEKNNINDLNLSEILLLYNRCSVVANKLKLKFDFDYKNKQVKVIDKNNDNILFNGGLGDIKKLYSNYLAVSDKINEINITEYITLNLDETPEIIYEDNNVSKKIIVNEENLDIENEGANEISLENECKENKESTTIGAERSFFLCIFIVFSGLFILTIRKLKS